MTAMNLYNTVATKAQAAVCATSLCANANNAAMRSNDKNTALFMDTAILAVSIFVYALISMISRISGIICVAIISIMAIIISGIIMITKHKLKPNEWIPA